MIIWKPANGSRETEYSLIQDFEILSEIFCFKVLILAGNTPFILWSLTLLLEEKASLVTILGSQNLIERFSCQHIGRKSWSILQKAGVSGRSKLTDVGENSRTTTTTWLRDTPKSSSGSSSSFIFPITMSRLGYNFPIFRHSKKNWGPTLVKTTGSRCCFTALWMLKPPH